MSRDTTVDPGTRSGFSKSTLKKCKYDNLLRLAKFLRLDVGDYPSPGYLAFRVSQATRRQGPHGPVSKRRSYVTVRLWAEMHLRHLRPDRQRPSPRQGLWRQHRALPPLPTLGAGPGELSRAQWMVRARPLVQGLLGASQGGSR